MWGVSAGGLLAGAVLTMRPDLANLVVAGVPFLVRDWSTLSSRAFSNSKLILFIYIYMF